MGLPQLKSCCCGCSLSLGTKLIGWLSLIGSVASMFIVWMLFLTLEYPQIKEDKRIEPYIPMIKGVFWVLIVNACISLVFSIILLKGAHEGKPKYVKLWIYFSIVMLIISCVIKVAMLISFSQLTSPFELLYIPLTAYFIWVVYSFYREQIRDPNRC